MADAEEGNKFDIKKLYALPRPRKLLAMILAEFVGTFLLVLLGCMTILGNDLKIVNIAVGWGFIVGHIVLVFGPISGAHVNPAVTTANIVLGSMSPLLALIYYVCQFLGSILAALVLKVIISKKLWDESAKSLDGNGVCVTFPSPNTTAVQAMFIEFFATSFLILIVCSVHDHRTQHHRDSFEIKVAGVIICDVICIAELTCASLNTARTFGPALINNFWRDHWVYWAGPLLAGIVTPIFYLIFWMPKKKPLDVDAAIVQNLFVALRKGPDDESRDEYQ